MLIALRIVKYLFALLAVAVAVAFLLPAEFKTARSVEIAAPTDRVFALVADQRQWARWSVWTRRDPQMKQVYLGPQAAVGARWSWRSATEGSGSMEWTAVETGKRIGYTLRIDGQSPAHGEILFAPMAGGTRVTWTIAGQAGANPFLRWFGLFFDRAVGPDFETGLAQLKQLAEQQP